MNKDSYTDIIVGLYTASPLGRSGAGLVYVVYGKAGGFTSDINLATLTSSDAIKIYGASANDQIGNLLEYAGDFNGDGIDDLIISVATANSNTGKIYIIFGKTTGLADIDLSTLTSSQGITYTGWANSGFGIACKSAGDMNSDGIDDIVVIANQNTYCSGCGSALVIYGTTTPSSYTFTTSWPSSSTQGYKISSDTSNYFGNDLGNPGDMNGDNIPDIIIAARSGGPSGSYAGSAYIIYGKAGTTQTSYVASALTASQGCLILGSANDGLGLYTQGAGDVNGDGKADIMVQSSPGVIWIMYGGFCNGMSQFSVSSLSSTTGFKILNAAGSAISRAGDINGDGASDVVLGLPNLSTNSRDHNGVVYVAYGKVGGGLSDVDFSTSVSSSRGIKILGSTDFDYAGNDLCRTSVKNRTETYDVAILRHYAVYIMHFGTQHYFFSLVSYFL